MKIVKEKIKEVCLEDIKTCPYIVIAVGTRGKNIDVLVKVDKGDIPEYKWKALGEISFCYQPTTYNSFVDAISSKMDEISFNNNLYEIHTFETQTELTEFIKDNF